MTKAKLVNSKTETVRVGQVLMTKMTLTVEAVLVPNGPEYEELVRMVRDQDVWVAATPP